ncbi:MAG: hypothetical protein LBS85_04845 [Clostridiales Family XIII bacterium]|jgi:hypothetical protein|nr:hypothetical protein [Clostridiales Family XIII bacterium]
MMYADYPDLIFGFHGCDKETYRKVTKKSRPLLPSNNAYDWLGSGIYFWENSYARALDWAGNRYENDAAVIGAVLDLGHCLNLTDYENAAIVRNGYISLKAEVQSNHLSMPQNKNIKDNDDWLIRDLDCAVINQVHILNDVLGKEPFDSVRGIFTEGKPIYPGAGFRGKTHVQLCIRSAKCIKGYFAPLDDEGRPIKY